MNANSRQFAPTARACSRGATLGVTIRLSGRLTVEDYRRIGEMYSGDAGKWQWRIIEYWIFPAGVIALVAFTVRALQRKTFAEFLTSFRPVQYIVAIAVFVVVGLFFMLTHWVHRRQREACDKHEGIYAEQQYEFSDDGVFVVSKDTETRMNWDAFSKHKSGDDYLVLHLKEHWVAIHVAKKWFADENEWLRLLDFVRGRLPSA